MERVGIFFEWLQRIFLNFCIDLVDQVLLENKDAGWLVRAWLLVNILHPRWKLVRNSFRKFFGGNLDA